MNNPLFITFTGADDHTDPRDMVELSRMYSVEWGILLSDARHGTARYPSADWIGRLREHASQLTLAVHLCGNYARHCMATGTLGWMVAPIIADLEVKRIQVNGKADEVNVPRMVDMAERVDVELVLQTQEAIQFPFRPGVHWLYDASGGKGVEPDMWPAAPPFNKMGYEVGYAGGLSPHNVAERNELFRQLASKYWIDMESGVRDEAGRFDINKCEAVCRAVYGDPQ